MTSATAWFSSGLWPFSTMGWPKQTPDLENFYPGSVLETGWDILFFWIARMIMLGLKLTGKVPFTEVFCHSLVRDSDGRKMSKSLGNVVDPLDVISGIALEDLHGKLLQGNLHPDEVQKATKYQKTAFPDGIPQCGADALRFTMVNATTGGGDINLDIKVIHGYRKFCNKIFQATKYVLGSLPQGFLPASQAATPGKTLAERWILHKMNSAARDINKALADREFSRATLIVYRYWYNELCDVYIENSKAIIRDGTEEERQSAIQTLYTSLEGALTMIHPFMPFITEEMWQRMPRRPGGKVKSIMVARYPSYTPILDDPESEAAYELVLGCSKAARSLIAEYSLKGETDSRCFPRRQPREQIKANAPFCSYHPSLQRDGPADLRGTGILHQVIERQSCREHRSAPRRQCPAGRMRGRPGIDSRRSVPARQGPCRPGRGD